MLVGIDGLDGLFGMHGSCRSNDYRLQAFMFEHFIVVLVQSHTKWLQVCLGPFKLGGIGGARSDEFRTRSSFEEVQSMTLAHAAEAGTADFH